MARVSLPRTTHTIELAQLDDLNARLGEHRSAITAADLGLAGATGLNAGTSRGLPGSAVLARLCWDGPPDYPYVHAHFTLSDPPPVGEQETDTIVDLHTAALRELSRRLGTRQQWGA
jgi:hypothetical protein